MGVAAGLSFRSYLVNFMGITDVTFNTLSVCCQIILFTHEKEPTISRKNVGRYPSEGASGLSKCLSATDQP